MNKNGFTIVELITTFALSTVIIVMLINVTLIIKDIYSKNDIKTSLLIEQSTLSHLINKKLTINSLNSYASCSATEFCYNFYFIDGTISTLKVTNKYIIFDNYVYKPTNGTTIGDSSVEIIPTYVLDGSVNDSFLVIKVPITNKLYPNDDFGLNIVYQFNSNKVTL